MVRKLEQVVNRVPAKAPKLPIEETLDQLLGELLKPSGAEGLGAAGGEADHHPLATSHRSALRCSGEVVEVEVPGGLLCLEILEIQI